METVDPTAQADRYCVTWAEVRTRLVRLLERLPHSRTSVVKVYGIPRGGAVVSAMLANTKGIRLVEDPREADFFVDDIVDSGKTAACYLTEYGKQTLALFNRESPDCPHGWIHFPWDSASEAGPEDGVIRLLQYIGEDPTRDGLRDTPSRVARALREMTRGYAQDPVETLGRTFEIACDEMVVLNGIRFSSLCEHHMLPFSGVAAVAYIPGKRVVGISKLARVVECFALRLQVQERLTKQIADAVNTALEPKGVGVLLRAHHSCMGCRGARQPDAEMVTSSLLGCFRDDGRARMEFLELARKGTQ